MRLDAPSVIPSSEFDRVRVPRRPVRASKCSSRLLRVWKEPSGIRGAYLIAYMVSMRLDAPSVIPSSEFDRVRVLRAPADVDLVKASTGLFKGGSTGRCPSVMLRCIALRVGLK